MNNNIYKIVFFCLIIKIIVFSSSPIQAQQPTYVSSLHEQGVKFTAKSTITFRLSIQGGAYENCPPTSLPDNPELWGWQTYIIIYKNRPVDWSGVSPVAPYANPANWDYALGDWHHQPTYAEAAKIGQGEYVDIPLNKGDYLILMAYDSKNCFPDNSGAITIQIQPKIYGLFVGVDYPASNSFGLLDDAEGAMLIEINWSILENNAPFQVLPLQFNIGGVDPSVIQSNINTFVADPTIAPGDNFIFYIAGHGFVDQDNSKEYILIGTTNTANYGDQSSWLKLYKDDLANWLKGLDDKGVNIWVILQSCHSAGFWNGALQNLQHVGFIASAQTDSPAFSDIMISKVIGMFTRQLSKLLYDQSDGRNTIDLDQDGEIDFDELANAAQNIGGIVQNQIGKLVYYENSLSPVTFSLDMWTPFSQKTPGFSGLLPGAPTPKNPPIPLLLLLTD